MSDGASYGIGAERAIDTILGGKPSPKKEEGMTPSQMYAMLMATPDSMSGFDYNLSANIAAKRIMNFLIDHPEYRELPAEDDIDFEEWRARNYGGKAKVVSLGISGALEKHGIDIDEGLGLSGFQYGWAVNAAKYALGAPPVPNSAIVEIKVK